MSKGTSKNDSNMIKCVVVGDGTVGKTCLLIVYAKGEFPKKYVPTIFDHYSVNVNISGQTRTLSLFDTAGQEEYDKLRLIAYSGADVFLICFSVVQPDSFANVELTWVNELRENSKNVPILLVGTKSDLRNDKVTIEDLAKKKLKAITHEEGRRMAQKLKLVNYIECSALKNDGVKNIFDEAILAVLNKENKSRKGCFIL